MVLYIGIYIESDWLYHAEWVALSNGQSGSELAEYSAKIEIMKLTIVEGNLKKRRKLSVGLKMHMIC